jgi:hypothetical protein
MKTFGVSVLERPVRRHSDFRGAVSEIGVLLDSVPPTDGGRDRRETQPRIHRVSPGVLSGITASMRLLWS